MSGILGIIKGRSFGKGLKETSKGDDASVCRGELCSPARLKETSKGDDVSGEKSTDENYSEEKAPQEEQAAVEVLPKDEGNKPQQPSLILE